MVQKLQPKDLAKQNEYLQGIDFASEEFKAEFTADAPQRMAFYDDLATALDGAEMAKFDADLYFYLLKRLAQKGDATAAIAFENADGEKLWPQDGDLQRNFTRSFVETFITNDIALDEEGNPLNQAAADTKAHLLEQYKVYEENEEFFGAMAPAQEDVPQEILDQLEQDIAAELAADQMAQKLDELAEEDQEDKPEKLVLTADQLVDPSEEEATPAPTAGPDGRIEPTLNPPSLEEQDEKPFAAFKALLDGNYKEGWYEPVKEQVFDDTFLKAFFDKKKNQKPETINAYENEAEAFIGQAERLEGDEKAKFVTTFFDRGRTELDFLDAFNSEYKGQQENVEQEAEELFKALEGNAQDEDTLFNSFATIQQNGNIADPEQRQARYTEILDDYTASKEDGTFSVAEFTEGVKAGNAISSYNRFKAAIAKFYNGERYQDAIDNDEKIADLHDQLESTQTEGMYSDQYSNGIFVASQSPEVSDEQLSNDVTELVDAAFDKQRFQNVVTDKYDGQNPDGKNPVLASMLLDDIVNEELKRQSAKHTPPEPSEDDIQALAEEYDKDEALKGQIVHDVTNQYKEENNGEQIPTNELYKRANQALYQKIVEDLKAEGLDQKQAEEFERISDEVEAEYAAAQKAAGIEALAKSYEQDETLLNNITNEVANEYAQENDCDPQDIPQEILDERGKARFDAIVAEDFEKKAEEGYDEMPGDLHNAETQRRFDAFMNEEVQTPAQIRADIVDNLEEMDDETQKAFVNESVDGFIAKHEAPEPQKGQKFKAIATVTNGLRNFNWVGAAGGAIALGAASALLVGGGPLALAAAATFGGLVGGFAKENKIGLLGAAVGGMAARSVVTGLGLAPAIAGLGLTASSTVLNVATGGVLGATAGAVGNAVMQYWNAYKETRDEACAENPELKDQYWKVFVRNDAGTMGEVSRKFRKNFSWKSVGVGATLGAATGGIFAFSIDQSDAIADRATAAYDSGKEWVTGLLDGWGGDASVAESPDLEADNDALAAAAAQADAQAAEHDNNAAALDGAEPVVTGAEEPVVIAGGGDLEAEHDPLAAAAVQAEAQVAEHDANQPVTIPEGIDPALKATIMEAMNADGSLSQTEKGIAWRLEHGSLAQQIQAAKDFTTINSSLQLDVLNTLDDSYGHLLTHPDAASDPQLIRALTQVNSDLGYLELRDGVQANLADGDAKLVDAIQNIMQANEHSNLSAIDQQLAFAQSQYPEAYAQALAVHTGAETTVVAVDPTNPDNTVIAAGDNCDDAVVAAAAQEPVVEQPVTGGDLEAEIDPLAAAAAQADAQAAEHDKDVVQPEPVVVQPEPVVVQQETVVAADPCEDPVQEAVVQPEPVVVQPEPVVVQQETVVAADPCEDPVQEAVVQPEPVVVQPEPVVVQPEPLISQPGQNRDFCAIPVDADQVRAGFSEAVTPIEARLNTDGFTVVPEGEIRNNLQRIASTLELTETMGTDRSFTTNGAFSSINTTFGQTVTPQDPIYYISKAEGGNFSYVQVGTVGEGISQQFLNQNPFAREALGLSDFTVAQQVAAAETPQYRGTRPT